MKFCIQISNPRTVLNYTKECEDIADAIEEIYPMNTEDVYIHWNHIRVPVGYKYDVGIMIFDILEMLESLLISEASTCNVNFGSDTFLADWELKWDNQQVHIKANWISTYGNIEDILNERSELTIDKYEFIAEWKMLLKRLITDLEKMGMSYEDDHYWKLLKKIEALIVDKGILYRDDVSTA